MKRFINSRLSRIASVILASTVGLYGLANPTEVYGDVAYSFDNQQCMADAYIEKGGSLSKNALNCTANDVEITKVTPVDPNAECTLGKTFELQADITVRTNASERYDTTFYLPLTEQIPKVVSVPINPEPNGLNYPDYCSLLVPGVDIFAGTAHVDLDNPGDGVWDECGDITKALGPDEYVIKNQTITMLCIDEDKDQRADFNYCAAWDNQERQNCTLDDDPVIGQVPSTSSKCNCDTFNIDVFIRPDPPEIVKTLISGSPADEPQGIFKYHVEITNVSTQSDIKINAVNDIVRSSTDSAVFADFDLTATADTTIGNVTLLATHGDHTCDTALDLPITLTPSLPTVQCDIMVQIDDDDLPDDGTDELYQDFIRAVVVDKNNDPVGDDNCDPTALTPVTPENGTCSNVVQVAMQDVDPSITISKFATDGPGYKCVGGTVNVTTGECSGTVFIDEPGGDVTYKLVITNTSTVDPLTVTSLKDYVMDGDTRTSEMNLLSLASDTTCNDSLPIDLAVNGEAGDSLTCEFVRDVSGGLITVRNEAEVYAEEQAGHSEGNSVNNSDSEQVTIADVPPTVTLKKEVKVAGEPDSAFAESAGVDEPAGNVVYRFTVTNTSPAEEDIRLLSLTDGVLAGERVTQTGTNCAFDGTVIIVFGTPYVCTIDATVEGNAGDNLVNTAFVTITDEETNLDSNEDSATVTFADVAPQFSLGFGFSTIVFIDINASEAFEELTLHEIKIRNYDVPLPLTEFVDEETGVMNLINDNEVRDYRGIAYKSCEVGDPIAAGSTYRCHFIVEHLPEFSDIDFNAPSTDQSLSPIVVTLKDPEGNAVLDTAELHVQAVITNHE